MGLLVPLSHPQRPERDKSAPIGRGGLSAARSSSASSACHLQREARGRQLFHEVFGKVSKALAPARSSEPLPTDATEPRLEVELCPADNALAVQMSTKEV